MTTDFIYLDYAATTPLDATVAARMREVQSQEFGNPASNHILGRRAADLVAGADASIRALLGANDGSILWTSGATESNNLALLGTAEQRAHRGMPYAREGSHHEWRLALRRRPVNAARPTPHVFRGSPRRSVRRPRART